MTEILDGVEWICTINEPNMLALMVLMARAINPDAVPAFDTPTVQRGEGSIVIPRPTLEVGRRLVDAHHAARAVLKERTDREGRLDDREPRPLGEARRTRSSSRMSATPEKTSTSRARAATTSSACSPTRRRRSTRPAWCRTRRAPTTP